MKLKKNILYLIPALVLVIALGLAWAAPKNLSNIHETYRMLGSNQQTRLSSHVGSATLLVFWASWCAPCIAEIPNLNEVFKRYQGTGLKIVALNIEQTPDETVRRMIQRHRVRYPVGVPSEGLVNSFQIAFIPASFIYDAMGNLVHQWYGPPTLQQLEEKIKIALKTIDATPQAEPATPSPTPQVDPKQ